MLLRRVAASLFLLAATATAEPLPGPKILERYKQMLAANPAEGTALDRLWKAYADAGQTAELIAEYEEHDTFASELILGHLLRKAARETDAEAAFARAAGLDPTSPLPLLALARLHTEKNRYAEAARAFERAIAALPAGDARLAETLTSLGAAWLAAGDVDRAVEAWERTVALAPHDLDLRRRLAESYTQHRLPLRAIAHLEYLVGHAPPAGRVQALQQLARIHQAGGRIDDAARSLEQAIALTTPGNWLRAELQGQLVRLHERFQRVAELEQRWALQAAENPRDLGALLQLVELHERLGNLDEQRVWLEKLVALAPGTPAYRERLARLLVELDQPEPAVAIYDQLLAGQPGNADLTFARAHLDIRRDAPQAARDRIETLLAQKKGDESIRAKALEFYEQHRLWEMVERHLAADAASGAEEAITALASFHFSQRRDADAERELRRLVLAGDPAEKRAAAFLRIAQILRGQNLLEASITALDEAAKLTAPDAPPMREIQIQIGELHATLGRHSAAREALEFAVSLSSSAAEIEEADQKLFNALRQQAASSEAPRLNALSARVQAALPSSARDVAAITPALAQVLADVVRSAEERPSEQTWLRAARWHHWTRDLPAARAHAGKALALNPASIPAHELLLKLAAADPNAPMAAWHLAKLAELDPDRRVDYQRRAAALDLQNGRATQALRTLNQLAHAHPGNLDVLTDLALAQQRAERWEDALTTWRQLHTISPASRKKEVLTQMQRVFERLGQLLPAAEMLVQEIDARPDARDQSELFQDLLAHCVKHSLLPWLRAQWAQRRERFPDDPATELAFGRILKAAGENAAAFDVLRNASLAAPNPAETLPELVREAEELRRPDAAIELQARLVRMIPQARPDALEKLAALQEKNFAPDDAARTWEKVVTRFPRDAVALMHAVEFHLRSGEPGPAAELLRKVRVIEPANVRALFTLARLDVESGEPRDNAEAEACLEEILRLPADAKPGDAIHFPGVKPEDAGQLQNRYLNTVRQRRGGRVNAAAMRALRSFWVEAPREDESGRDLRLKTVRELARLIRAKDDPATLARWVARWKAQAEAAPSEALWALFHADAGEATLDVAAALLQREPADVQRQQAFIWLALQTRQFTRLSDWMRDRQRTASERDFVLIALGQHLQNDGERIDPAMLAGLFPPGTRVRLWQAATLYAQHGRFADAANLGRRAMEAAAGSQRASMGVELANWHLCLGEPGEARRLLREVSRGPAETFDAPAYLALRQAWLLQPEEERAAFSETIERELDDRTFPVHAAITRSLLRGLAGDLAAARVELRRLLAMPALPPVAEEASDDAQTRLWNFILQTGMRLQAWKLDGMAVAWWEEALADPALVRLQGEPVQEIAREARTRLYALRVARAAPAEVDALLAEYRRSAPAETLTPLGEALDTLGAHPRAIETYRRIWEAEPGNPQALRNLLTACRAAPDVETAEATLRTCVAQRLYHFNETLHRDLLMQWIDLLEQRGAYEEALALLRGAVEATPNDPRLFVRLAEHAQRAGRLDEAEIAWRRVISIESQHTTARVSLAALLEKQGKLEPAIAAVTNGGSAESEAKLILLLHQSGRTDEALHTLDRLTVAPAHIAAAQALAKAMVLKGDGSAARGVLQNAAAKNGEPLVAMQLQRQIIESFSPATDRGLITRELRKMRRMAGDDPGRQGFHFAFLQTHAQALGVEESAAREVREAWADGAGSLPAGMVLLGWLLDRGDPAASDLLDRLLARDDTRDSWLVALIKPLEAAKRPDLLVRVRERLTRLEPLGSWVLGWARELDGTGRRDEALTVIERWGARAALDDEFATEVARVLADFGLAERAERLLTHALRGDAGVRGGEGIRGTPRVQNNHGAHLDLARLRMARGDLRGAKRLLLVAFQHPGNVAFDVLVEWLMGAGQIGQAERALGEFQLSPRRMMQALRAVFAHFEKQGQTGAAARWLDTHPAILERGMPERLRALAAKTGSFDAAAAALERLATQGESEASVALALLLGDWADTEMITGQAEAALGRLSRAHELRPDLFAIAQKISALHRARGETQPAAAALARFIAAARDPQEKAHAERLLAEMGNP